MNERCWNRASAGFINTERKKRDIARMLTHESIEEKGKWWSVKQRKESQRVAQIEKRKKERKKKSSLKANICTKAFAHQNNKN